MRLVVKIAVVASAIMLLPIVGSSPATAQPVASCGPMAFTTTVALDSGPVQVLDGAVWNGSHILDSDGTLSKDLALSLGSGVPTLRFGGGLVLAYPESDADPLSLFADDGDLIAEIVDPVDDGMDFAGAALNEEVVAILAATPLAEYDEAPDEVAVYLFGPDGTFRTSVTDVLSDEAFTPYWLGEEYLYVRSGSTIGIDVYDFDGNWVRSLPKSYNDPVIGPDHVYMLEGTVITVMALNGALVGSLDIEPFLTDPDPFLDIRLTTTEGALFVRIRDFSAPVTSTSIVVAAADGATAALVAGIGKAPGHVVAGSGAGYLSSDIAGVLTTFKVNVDGEILASAPTIGILEVADTVVVDTNPDTGELVVMDPDLEHVFDDTLASAEAFFLGATDRHLWYEAGQTAFVYDLGTCGIYDGTFADDDGSIFESDIEWLAAEGITAGCNPPLNHEFCPTNAVTRGQMAAFMVRALGLTDDGGGNAFVDDDDSIFEADIAKLAAAGITRGCNPPTNDQFCPTNAVTRGQMAAFMVRALGLTDDGGGNAFVDDDDSIFEADIAKLAAAGITRGCNPPTNDQFCAGADVTREQMAAFLHRALMP